MSLIDCFLSWWLRSGRYQWSRLRRKLCERKYLATALPVVNSLQEIEHYLNQVTWTMDGPLHLFDCISYPQTTWSKKKDDCDGFASLAAKLLDQWDAKYNPVLVTAIVRPVRVSHTVCAFLAPQGGVWFFDNYSLRRENCQTYNDVVVKIIPPDHKLLCWDVRKPTTLELLEFHKQQ